MWNPQLARQSQFQVLSIKYNELRFHLLWTDGINRSLIKQVINIVVINFKIWNKHCITVVLIHLEITSCNRDWSHTIMYMPVQSSESCFMMRSCLGISSTCTCMVVFAVMPCLRGSFHLQGASQLNDWSYLNNNFTKKAHCWESENDRKTTIN